MSKPKRSPWGTRTDWPMLSVKISPKLAKRLKHYAKRAGWSTRDTVNVALTFWLNQQGEP